MQAYATVNVYAILPIRQEPEGVKSRDADKSRPQITPTIRCCLRDLAPVAGEHFRQAIDDETYRDFLSQLVHGQQIDFIFEEGSGHQPTHASKFAEAQSPRLGYLDIDPPRTQRKKYGLAEDTGSTEPTDLFIQPAEFSYWEKPAEHVKREKFWLRKIDAAKFRCALVVCGYFHIRSFSARLLDEGFELEASFTCPITNCAP